MGITLVDLLKKLDTLAFFILFYLPVWRSPLPIPEFIAFFFNDSNHEKFILLNLFQPAIVRLRELRHIQYRQRLQPDDIYDRAHLQQQKLLPR